MRGRDRPRHAAGSIAATESLQFIKNSYDSLTLFPDSEFSDLKTELVNGVLQDDVAQANWHFFYFPASISAISVSCSSDWIGFRERGLPSISIRLFSQTYLRIVSASCE